MWHRILLTTSCRKLRSAPQGTGSALVNRERKIMVTLRRSGVAPMEFHVSRTARDRYQFDDTLFTLSGNVIFANFHAARVFAQRMNQKHDLINYPEQAVRASQINALGLIHEITHHMFKSYRDQHSPQLLHEALDWLSGRLGATTVDAALKRFTDEFPPLAVYRREIDIDTYLVGETNGVPNRQVVLEELLMLWLANANSAFSPFLELFDDTNLEKQTAYPTIVSALYEFFGTKPGVGPGGIGVAGGGVANLMAGAGAQ